MTPGLAATPYPQVSALKSGLGKTSPSFSTSQPDQSPVPSLAALWAKKYYSSVTSVEEQPQPSNTHDFKEVTTTEGRQNTAKKLMDNLTLASAQAWSMTETLLSEEIRRHGINPDLINPLEIAADTRYLFQKVLEAYAERSTPRRLSVIVGKDFGQVRQKYTRVDRRAIGFVSMQFHHTGQKLLQWLSNPEQILWKPYLKVMDDHMYMPLQAAYEAAANHPYDSEALTAVRHLLPVSSKIAVSVCQQICHLHPNYKTYSGSLHEVQVKTASIRDAEMFQVYLCLCVLENHIQSVQQELFPLCVMLYPCLNVSWKLVQDMLQVMGWQMHERLPPEQMATFLPYLRVFSEMFASDVFQND